MGQKIFMGYKVVIPIKLLHGTVWDDVGLSGMVYDGMGS